MKLEDRKKALSEQFETLEAERKKLVDQGSVIQKRISEIQTEQVRLQGSYREIELLLNFKEATEPKLELVE